MRRVGDDFAIGFLALALGRWHTGLGRRGSVHDGSLVCCDDMKLTVLYRPVGQREYELIKRVDSGVFPLAYQSSRSSTR